MITFTENGKQRYNHITIVQLILTFLLILLPGPLNSASEYQKKWVIVIDAGHGGKDPGALGSYSSEKNITLAIALKAGEYLEKNLQNVKVIYTRKTDIFVDLKDRATIANKNNADLFISIHANWAPSKKILGAETFIMGLAKDEANLQVAMKENEVILLEKDHSTKYEGFDPKSPESYIMFTLMQNVYQEQSTLLAAKIQSQFHDKVKRADRGVKQAGFWVLYMTTMPSVLVETGFITHPSEEKFLNSKQGQDYLASAIFRACREYIAETESRSGISAVEDNAPGETGNKTEESDKLYFMVQIATSSIRNEIKPENFRGLKDVAEIKETDRYKYLSGRFSDYAQAVKHRKDIADIYPDAFVIAVRNSKTIPLQQALDEKNRN